MAAVSPLQDPLDRARWRWHVAASPASAGATLLAGAVQAQLLSRSNGWGLAGAWWLALAAVMGLRMWWRHRTTRRPPPSDRRVRRGLRRVRLLFGLHGLVWVASVGLMTAPQAQEAAAHASAFIVAAMIGGALVTSAFDLRAASAFAMPVGLALLLRLAGWGGPAEPTLLLVTAVFIGVMALAGWRASQLLERQTSAELAQQEQLAQTQRHADEAEAARQALAHQHGLMQQLIRNTRQGFWFLDTEGRTRDLNPAMCALLGLPREAVIGRHVLDFFDGEQRTQLQDQLARRRQGESSTYEIDVRQPDGRWRHAVNQATPVFDLQGRPLGSIGLWTDLSAQKALEDELRMHEHVSNSITDALAVIDREGQCLLVNDAWCQLLGLNRAQALQQRVDRRGSGPLQAIDPAAIARCFALGTEQTQVVPVPGVGGTDKVLQTTLVPYRDGTAATERVLLVLRDTTAQAQDRQAVAVAAEHLDRTLNATQDAIFASDATTPDEPVRFANQQLRRLFGLPMGADQPLTPRQILAAALPLFADPEHEQAVIRHTMASHEPAEHALRLHDGRVLLRRCQQTWVQGHWLRVWSFRDISAEERLRGLLQEREAAQQALAAALQAAEQANRAKSQFLSHMSHELRTPLNGIAGFAQLLRRDQHPALAEHQRGYARQILRGSEHLLDLINDVLDLASVEAGRLVVEPQAVPVAEVVDDCQAMVETLAAARGVHLLPATGLAGTHALVALADRRRLRQVLLNLLGNAIKYNRPGGHVQVCGQRVGDLVQIAVQDSGRGLSADEQARLFTPFERLDAARGPVEGTGIGLVLSRRLVHAMGGQLDVHSEPGVGSSFRVQLPAASPGALPPRAEPQATFTGNERPAPGGLKLLYVDDNEVNLMVVAALAHGNADLQVLTATNGPAGLALARAEQPDLVLLDIHMPEMDGYAVLAALQSDPATAAIPVVALSADASTADVQAARSAGFADYLIKPLDLDHLLGTAYTLARRSAALH